MPEAGDDMINVQKGGEKFQQQEVGSEETRKPCSCSAPQGAALHTPRAGILKAITQIPEHHKENITSHSCVSDYADFLRIGCHFSRLKCHAAKALLRLSLQLGDVLI